MKPKNQNKSKENKMATKRKTRRPNKNYKITMGTGALFFIRARSKGEAREFANAEAVNMYGKVKYIASIDEVSAEDIENYPGIFRKLRLSTRLPRGRGNPGAAWHSKQANLARMKSGAAKTLVGSHDYSEEATFQERMANASKALGIPNPAKKTAKKSRFGLGSIALVGGLAYLIWKNYKG
jgi:hypothetical protein